MNAYYAVAEAYFEALEGWHLYPGPRSWLLWTWIFLAIGWVASIVWFVVSFSSTPFWGWSLGLVVGLEIPLLFATGAISSHKHAALIGIPHRKQLTPAEIAELRTRLLCQHLKAKPEQFLEMIKEIKDLKATRTEFRYASDMEWGFFLRKIYDPDSKPRVLALFLAGLAIFTALTVKAADWPAVFEMIESPGLVRLLMGILLIPTMLFSMFVGAQAVLAVLSTGAAIWMAKTFKTKANDTALRYLVRDMASFYQPRRLVSETGAGPSRRRV